MKIRDEKRNGRRQMTCRRPLAKLCHGRSTGRGGDLFGTALQLADQPVHARALDHRREFGALGDGHAHAFDRDVDDLRAAADPVEIWYALGAQERECVWARALAGLPGALIPAPHFGASDCRCPAHTVHFVALPDSAAFAYAVGDTVLQEKLHV